MKHHQITATLNAMLLYSYYGLYIISIHYYVFIHFHYYQPLGPLYINIYTFANYYTIVILF